jgi:hypothetical protein
VGWRGIAESFDALRVGALVRRLGYAEVGRAGSTAHLVAPDPATPPFWGAEPVRLTVAAEAQRITDPGRVPCRASAKRLGAEPLKRIQPAARPPGSTGASPGQETIRDLRSGSLSAVPSRAGLSAERRRRRREVEVLLVVRRAEQARGLLLDGGPGVRSQT